MAEIQMEHVKICFEVGGEKRRDFGLSQYQPLPHFSMLFGFPFLSFLLVFFAVLRRLNSYISAYILSCLFFAYAEGYKGFQLKFAPLVVKRSSTLVLGTSEGTILNFILAPLYSMGLFHATKKRTITSWSVTLAVAMIVAIVKRLSEPWRNIIDAGVVVGLSWGAISIVLFYIQSLWTGQSPSVDPCLPTKEKQ